ncbi:hypothetical protein GLA29479_4133 [Lysobacter antibioticus]|uniref:hypothetical protein n=1 Tax=Lysobacter antibioticus TaxID=84531 RepID=UPI0007203F75|nr:hypothetical protein [Lysobacter antibioticus]ALN64979.1 hypothetical protein GLA29479_4133 [Lysobacter antibioticus]
MPLAPRSPDVSIRAGRASQSIAPHRSKRQRARRGYSPTGKFIRETENRKRLDAARHHKPIVISNRVAIPRGYRYFSGANAKNRCGDNIRAILSLVEKTSHIRLVIRLSTPAS